jgi:dissimilatory sulfite reductase (desulfoviridin) alpha/beta subunit
MTKKEKEAQKQQEEEEKLCPRCNQPYNYLSTTIVNGREYVYAVHVISRSKGKVKLRKCYLGPKEEYINVSRLHEQEGLEFKPITDSNRALEYLEKIVDYLNEHGEKEQIREAKALMKTLKVRGQK